MNTMKNQMMEIASQMSEIDLNTVPNFITLKVLAEHPDIKYPRPLLVASSIAIGVNDEFIEDKELFNAMISSTVCVLNKIWVCLSVITSSDAEDKLDAFLVMVKTMSIKYN